MGTMFRWIFQPLCHLDLELIKQAAFRDLVYNEKSYSCQVKGLAVIFFLFSPRFFSNFRKAKITRDKLVRQNELDGDVRIILHSVAVSPTDAEICDYRKSSSVCRHQ